MVQTDYASQGNAHDNDDVAVDSTTGVVLLLEANQFRKSALISNHSDGTLRVTTDGSDPAENHGKRVVGGAALALSGPDCPTGPVKAFSQDGAAIIVNASEVD